MATCMYGRITGKNDILIKNRKKISVLRDSERCCLKLHIHMKCNFNVLRRAVEGQHLPPLGESYQFCYQFVMKCRQGEIRLKKNSSKLDDDQSLLDCSMNYKK